MTSSGGAGHESSRRPGGPRFYYGWRIVVAAGIAMMLTGPGQTLGVSVFVDPMIDELHVSRSQISRAYLVGTLGGALSLSTVGRGIDRFGLRAVMTFVGVAFSAAIALMAGVVGPVSMAIGFMGIRMFGQGALNLLATTSVAFWFEQRRGMAIGIASSLGFGAMSLVPLMLSGVIGVVGWRAAWLVTAPVVGIAVVALARTVVKDSPSDIGLAIDGLPLKIEWPSVDECPDRRPPEAASGTSLTRSQAMHTPAYWTLVGMSAASAMLVTALVFHQISVLGEYGLTPTQAAVAFVPMSLANVIFTLVAGALTDRISPRTVMLLPMVMLLAGMLMVQDIATGLMVVVYAALIGGTQGLVKSIEAALMPAFFGLGHLGSIRGVAMSINVAASALGPYVLAVGFERFGSYSIVLNVLAAIPILAILLMLVTPVPPRRALST